MAAIIQNGVMAGVQTCKAIKSKGDQCNTKSVAHGYCRVHMNSRKLHGPLTFSLMQLEYKRKGETAKIKHTYRLMLEDGDVAYRRYREDLALLKARCIQEERQIRNQFAAAPEEDKIMEEAAEQRRREKEQAKRIRQEQWRAQFLADAERRRREREDQELALRLDAEERVAAGWVAGVLLANRVPAHAWAGAEGVVFAPAAPPPPPAPVGERGIGDIARDNQSIHTTEVVRHTKEIVAKVREIPVPEGYRWDREICSKTPGEIIAECRLTQKAAHQMMSQYAQDTPIYDIEEGIYGKVLDSVWQFVKGHAEKDSLVAIIREEMQGNIGMCAQGNLTRICNVLSGYLDGVGVKETLAEKLGRLLPPLREIADGYIRHMRVTELLREHDVPYAEWDTWIDAVMED